MEIFLESHSSSKKALRLPLSSCAVLYILKYCQVPSVKVNFVTLDEVKAVRSTSVNVTEASLEGIECTCMVECDVSTKVKNCDLPVIQDEDGQMIRSGLCSCVRHLVSYSAKKNDDKTMLDLLGFRQGSLKACAEVSGWTKLCEIELPDTIGHLMNTLRPPKQQHSIELPAELMKLELNFEKPPPLHNDDKKKRALLNRVKGEMQALSKRSDPKCPTACSDFFRVREDFLPHGSMYYRVVTKSEKEAKKFVNGSCKLGCTENRLVKWCAKCNDREKEKQKKIQMSRNQNRKDQLNQSSDTDRTVLTPALNGDKCIDDVSTVDELTKYIKTLTLYDVEYEHTYAEGIFFTIADILLFVYFYHLMDSMKFKCAELFEHIPLIHKWLKHLMSLTKIQDAALQCGFDWKQLNSSLCDTGQRLGDITFIISEGVLDLEEENPEIARRSKAKVRALKNEVARVLGKVEENGITEVTGGHPKGTDIQVDWESVPFEVSPKVELPEKRVKRKCEQLENLATAVVAISKPGDIIVDFCSGGGHLGIIIAYLLPECTVYMIENNEESLKRATDRVKALKLDNVVLYQCNLDYFRGQFDIGVCLHACGVATDMVLQQCIERKASFVICPCCYGSIQNTHLITYPRSKFYSEAGFTDKDVILLGHAADQTEFNMDLQSQGRHCMNLVDTDRASLAKEYGYDVALCSLQPLTCTPKNNLLIGTAPVLLTQN